MAMVEDPWRTKSEGRLMAIGQQSQAAEVLRKLFSSFTNSRSVTENSVSSSPTDSPYEQVEHTISAPRAEHI